MPAPDQDPKQPRPGSFWARPDRGQLLWSVALNAIVVFAIVIAVIPIAALVHGFVDLVVRSKTLSGADAFAYGLAFTGLFLGAIFFTYAIKYYLGTGIVLLTTLVSGGRNGNGNGNGNHKSEGDRHAAGLSRINRNGNGNGNGYHIDLGYHPFVSIHVAAYNEKRVIERLLTSLEQLDYPEYEVVVVDDSTDESVRILERWKGRPRFKIGHRNSRLGFKGGALREALKVMDPRTEYVVIFDADSMPFPDSIERFLPYFYAVNGDKEVKRRYKVVYTPWAETPAECVSTFARLARQRMRWAEGHTYNVRKWFLPIMLSPFVRPLEKVEFLFDAAYYLQAALFVVGTVSWLLSELVFRAHIPGWTAALGWSLIFSNVFALPLMNLGGLILEDAPARDMQGVLGALVLSFALVPFQGWAALKGLLQKEEGPWFRTPKTGNITDPVKHLRRLHLLRRWLLGPRLPTMWGGGAVRRRGDSSNSARSRDRSSTRWIGWIVATGLLLAFAALAWGSTRVPIVQAAGNPLYLHGGALCAAPSLDQAAGSMTTPCSIQSTAGGVTTVFGFTNLPAQTVAAGTWSFTMNWTGGNGNTNDTVTLSAGISLTSSCTGFVATVPNGLSTWTATYGSSGANLTSPFTVTTSASQLPMVIPAGGSLCLQVVLTHSTGGKPSMVYDGLVGTADTRLVPPSTVVPESLVGWLGLAFAIPLVTQRRRLLALLRIWK